MLAIVEPNGRYETPEMATESQRKADASNVADEKKGNLLTYRYKWPSGVDDVTLVAVEQNNALKMKTSETKTNGRRTGAN